MPNLTKADYQELIDELDEAKTEAATHKEDKLSLIRLIRQIRQFDDTLQRIVATGQGVTIDPTDGFSGASASSNNWQASYGPVTIESRPERFRGDPEPMSELELLRFQIGFERGRVLELEKRLAAAIGIANFARAKS